jgi:prepilin peptidase CpaA
MRLLDLAAIGVAIAACGFDLRSHRIPNVLTFGAAVAAFAVALATGGTTAFGWSVAGWLVGLVLFLPVYAVGGMGAGDIKLLATIGAWLGPLGAFHTALYTGIAGALLALVVMYTHRCARQTFANVHMLLLHWRVAGFTSPSPLTLENSTSPRLAYALPMLIGTVASIWLG